MLRERNCKKKNHAVNIQVVFRILWLEVATKKSIRPNTNARMHKNFHF